MKKEIMVSIICNTYNQEDYIRDALDSFIKQKTNFAFEVLVHDDASTDNTTSIIKEYEKKYPDIIKPFYQKVNQYSQNIGITLNYQIPRAKGKYYAFCEGDDYWTDENKLQKQFDILESHPNIDICTHAAHMISSKTNKILTLERPCKKTKIISPQDVIKGGPGFVVTNSIFIRKSVYDKYKFINIYHVDYATQILGSLNGGMYYTNEIMSIYRYLSKGSFEERNIKDVNVGIIHSDKTIRMLDELNNETNYMYCRTIYNAKIKYIDGKLKAIYGKQYLMLPRCREVLSYLPRRIKLRTFVDKNFSCIGIIYRKTRKIIFKK